MSVNTKIHVTLPVHGDDFGAASVFLGLNEPHLN